MSVFPVPLLQEESAQQVLELGPKGLPAGLPVPNPTKSFWVDTPGANPLAKHGSEGPLTQDADVCIIGSGITGVSAAFHLSKMASNVSGEGPLKTVILEARDFCSGATGRNGGHLTPFVFIGFHRRELLWGTREAVKGFALEKYVSDEVVKILKEEGLGEKVDLVEGGHITLLVTEEEESAIRKDYEAAKKAGDVDLDRVEWVSKEEMVKTYGASFPGVGMSGHNLWPLKLVTELYNLAKDRNPSTFSLDLHTHTPVTGVSPVSNTNSGRRWLVETVRGSIACSYVIHATNGYASHLLPQLAGPEGIVPTRGQIVAVRANVSSAKLTKSSWDGNEGFEYWFPRPVKVVAPGEQEEHPLVILGGGRESSGPEFEYNETDDSKLHPRVGQALRAFLPALFPGRFEEGREPEMEWTGIMGYTKDGDPFVGPVRAEAPGEVDAFKGQYISAGYTGHGMPRAYACAEAVAGMVIADIFGGTWVPPEWLPAHYLAWPRH
ncbi:hypothetical protein AX16_007414 [Volvariella volvacea WC 439]|nr:hypothetical protein AX16_007414 [Volvariella volvacea WC 439]